VIVSKLQIDQKIVEIQQNVSVFQQKKQIPNLIPIQKNILAQRIDPTIFMDHTRRNFLKQVFKEQKKQQTAMKACGITKAETWRDRLGRLTGDKEKRKEIV